MAATLVPLPLPQQLTNGTVADATQVMTDLNYIAQQINANAAAPGTVANSVNSTLLGYLSTILQAGSGITLTTQNPGGAETLLIASSAASVQLAQMVATACLI